MAKTNEPSLPKLLFDQLRVAVMVIGRDDGIIRYVNHCVCEDLSKTRDNIEGKSYRQIFWPEFIPVFERLLRGCEDGNVHETIYYWAEMALWEQVSAQSFVWESRPCVLVSITTISEIMRSEYKFENMAYFDNLLKLPNGTKLEEDLSELANVEEVMLLYFAIDLFEEVNGLYGWDNGDNLLKQIRDWLLTSETHRVQLYRINNGFVLLGREVPLAKAESRIREIQHRFARPWTLSAGGNNISLYCTIKAGIVFGKYVKNEMRNILLRTLHAAEKSPGKYVLYDERADRETKRSIILRNSFINSIYNDMKGFDIHFQPLVDTKSQQWVALEALCRWTLPDGTPVSPKEFIHIAEQLNLIDTLDCWVRKTAMTRCVELRLPEKDFFLDVNFSPTQKIDDAFINGLFAALAETGFPAAKLNLEIIESTKMIFDEDNVKGLRRLKAKGVILSLDDFGTGYSSFANLIKISAHILKTEKLFLDGIEHDPYRQYLLLILVGIAHHLGMRMVAEGVETRGQYELLKKYNVDFAQGDLFSKPLSYDQLKNESWRFLHPSGESRGG